MVARKKAAVPVTPKWVVYVAIIAVVAIMSTVALSAIVLTRPAAPATVSQPAATSVSTTTYTGTKPVSAKQISYIQGLGVDTQRDITSFVEAMFKGLTLEELTTVQAGDVIDALNAIKYSTPATTP